MRDFDLRELQLCELDVLKELARICEKHHLQYYLAWGTCLGAVRHKGFIPWDDNIDVCMPWQDYLKFKEVCRTDLGEDYFYEDWYAHHDYFLYWAKLRKNKTTCMTRNEKDLDICWGVGIDIFPLFKNEGTTISMKKRMALIALEIVIKRSYLPYGKGIKKLIRKILLMLIPKKMDEKIITSCLNALESANLEASYLVDFSDNAVLLPEKVYGKGQSCQFEDKQFLIPLEANTYLTNVYGDDYMQIPEKHEQVDHGDIIVDLEKDYLEYK